MNKLYLLISFLMLFTLNSYSQDRYKVSIKSALNVRASSNASATVIGSLSDGEYIDVYSNENGWAQIRYNGKTGYVSNKYITLVQTAEQSAAQIEMNRVPWYDLTGWGTIGWLIIWVIIPFLLFGMGLIFIMLRIAYIEALSNFLCSLICGIVGFFYLKLCIYLMQMFNVYQDATWVLWIGSGITGFMVWSMATNGRCPNCHYMNSSIVDSMTLTRHYKKTTTYSDNTKEVKRYSRSETQNQHQCPRCASTWWEHR